MTKKFSSLTLTEKKQLMAGFKSLPIPETDLRIVLQRINPPVHIEYPAMFLCKEFFDKVYYESCKQMMAQG